MEEVHIGHSYRHLAFRFYFRLPRHSAGVVPVVFHPGRHFADFHNLYKRREKFLSLTFARFVASLALEFFIIIVCKFKKSLSL